MSNHELTVSGASEKLNYYLSLGYYTQEGIIGGDYDRSNYNRLTLRSNTKYTLFDESKTRNWLNKLDITVNLSYARVKSKSIDANSQWGSPLGSAWPCRYPHAYPYRRGCRRTERQICRNGRLCAYV